jgi:tRNA modification GTPase
MTHHLSDHDTIAAIATPPGRGAIGIVRLSGPEALRIGEQLFRGERGLPELKGFTAALGWVEDQGERLDQVLCLVMRAPKSYTCEDVVEFHCHGGPEPLRRVLQAALGRGARLAEPGEFTRRAFLAGRIDLSAAEAVAEVIESRTEAQARAALKRLGGGLQAAIGRLRAKVLELLVLLEAGIDFADEEDIPAISRPELRSRLAGLQAEAERMLRESELGRVVEEGFSVTILGRPNVGKSTLMNALLREDRVIVTPHPGTTRDVIEESLNLGGLLVRLGDTAGIRASEDAVEQLSVDRSWRAAAGADLVLLLLDGSQPLQPEDSILLTRLGDQPVLLVLNKADLKPVLLGADTSRLCPGAPVVSISALTGQGLDRLEAKIAELAGSGQGWPGESTVLLNLRQRQSLHRAGEALARAQAALEEKLSDEFVAADLRPALAALGEITGESVSEEILDLIFSRFCIGK